VGENNARGVIRLDTI